MPRGSVVQAHSRAVPCPFSAIPKSASSSPSSPSRTTSNGPAKSPSACRPTATTSASAPALQGLHQRLPLRQPGHRRSQAVLRRLVRHHRRPRDRQGPHRHPTQLLRPVRNRRNPPHPPRCARHLRGQIDPTPRCGIIVNVTTPRTRVARQSHHRNQQHHPPARQDLRGRRHRPDDLPPGRDDVRRELRRQGGEISGSARPRPPQSRLTKPRPLVALFSPPPPPHPETTPCPPNSQSPETKQANSASPSKPPTAKPSPSAKGYKTIASCKNGIESVRKNAPDASVDDQTQA